MIEAHEKASRIQARFAERIEKIRARVTLKLADKIQQAQAALPQMTGDDSNAVTAVATAYRWLHDVSGIGPVLGLEATGRQARTCANILLNPFLLRRGLSRDELAAVKNALEALRIATLNETHPIESNQRSAP